MFRTNRGKALMDEANVFLSGIIRSADERLTEGVLQQRDNARGCAGCRSSAAIVIVLVVGGVTITFGRYAREIAQARDESATSMPAWRRGSANAPPTLARRATAPKSCWRRSITASPTA